LFAITYNCNFFSDILAPARETMKPQHDKTPHGSASDGLEAVNRAMLITALDCIITMDATGKIREFNPAAERVFGFSREEAIGKELAELIIPPALRESHRRGLAHYLQTGEGPVLGRRIEINALRADGSEILVELAITAFEVDGALFFTAYLRDITERVRIEKRRAAQYTVGSLLAGSWTLKEAGAQILEAIASSGDWVHGSIWVYDESAVVLRCKTTWHPPTERMEKFAEVSRSIEFARGEGLPGRVWVSKKPTWIEDVTIDTNFPRAWVAAEVGLRGGFAFPLRVDGAVNGIIEFFSRHPVHPDQDLLHLVDALGIQIGLFIERRRIEQELKAEKERAEAANAAKDRFLAMLSHELRTPLTPVLIWAGGTSRQPDLDPEIKEGLQMICRNIELEARLIDDMLDLTRITRGKLEVRLGSADVHELLQRAMDIVRSEVEDRGARVSVALEATDHSLVVDSQRLQQVFWNILRNAYKFTPAEGEVAVRTYNPGPDTIAVEISDNGIGIEPRFLEKIFDAFEQVDTRREGLGLGLAISKAIIEAHGGTIRARSDGPGKGATFAIELPTRPRTESGAPG
jgi:two-component system cell cycle sensor histidine kinase/response regulator CckA